MKKKKIFKKIGIIFFLIAWVLTGWLSIRPLSQLGVNTIRIPPEIKEAHAAISTTITARGSAVSNASGTTLSVSPSANLVVGKVIFVSCVSDNNQTTDGASTFHSVSDTDGHTWTKISEWTETDGAADDGVTVSLFATKVVTQIDTTDSITLTLGAAKTDKIITILETTFDAGNTFAVEQVGIGQGSLTAAVSSLTSREYLLIGVGGAEGEDSAKTKSTNYTEKFDLITSTTGNLDVNIAIHVQTRVAALTSDSITSTAWTGTNYLQTLSAIYEVVAITAPTVTTQAASSVEATTATGNGNITATGGENADKRGFVYDTSTKSPPGNVAPASSGYASSAEDTGSFGTGAFTKGLTSLSGNMTYYTRAYAHNSAGYSYGDEVSFLTLPGAPGTQTFTNVKDVTLTVNWSAPTGGASSYKIERCSGSGCSNFAEIRTGETGTSYNDSGLTGNTLYRYRVRATNATGDGSYSGIGETTTGIVSITITSDGTISYGLVAPGASKDTTAGDTQTARNDGNIAENFNISTSNAIGGTQWTIGSSAGVNIFVHEFSTNSGSVWTKFTAADNYQTLATGIAPSGTQDFDLRITAPTDSDTQQKTITITVQAIAQ